MAGVVEALLSALGPEQAEAGGEVADDHGHDEALGAAPVRPLAVVLPRSTDDVVATVRACAEHGTPLTARGSGTGLSGACIPRPDGVVLAFEGMDRILDVDVAGGIAVVQPGVRLEQLDEALAPHGLAYAVRPGEYSASLGGNVATNAGGMQAVKHGVTRHHVLGLEVVLATGEVLRTGGRTVKASSGYDLTQLVVGSEGTLAVVTEATLKLVADFAMRILQEAVANGQQAGCGCYNGAITTIEPATGQVLLYAPNSDPTYTSDPRVAGNIDQLTEINQPGSSFKPAVYLAWMDKLQKTPLSSIWDTSPMPISPPNTPPAERVTITNPRAGGGGEGLITMRLAMGGSQNVPAFRAAMEVGVDEVISYAKALGITTLEQKFDPTFRSHDSVIYGPSIATGGANVRPIDMAYMNATISNMGYMVGVPTLAREIDLGSLKSLEGAEGSDYDEALQQRSDFQKGYLRLPNSRPLDPVTVLKVVGISGETLYEHGSDLQRIEVVNPGSVWMLNSVMSDCTARVIIWQCGTSNSDLSLDSFMDGVKIPTGVKTGTQQGFVRAEDTLATWMNGYSRYAANVVWIGNADKSLVRDGPGANYASANTTVRLFKSWMGVYHAALRDRDCDPPGPAGQLDDRPAGGARLLDVELDVLRHAGAPSVVQPRNRVVNAQTADGIVARWTPRRSRAKHGPRSQRPRTPTRSRSCACATSGARAR